MSGGVERVRARLFALRDEKVRAFNAKLLPNLDPSVVIGVRTPALRKLARELSGTPDAAEFLAALPHETFEENNLHGFLIERIRDWDECVAALEAFLPHIDNWATCDQTAPKALIRRPEALRERIDAWLDSGRTYTVRYGAGMLLRHFLDERFEPGDLARVAGLVPGEYYVDMMVAWYFATALAKQWDAALLYIETRRLPEWTHNRAIQKATESDRIPPERKKYLRDLRISSRKRS